MGQKLTKSDFKAELDLIDKYVDIKDKGDGQPIILTLIEEFFLPMARIEESRSWRNALTDKQAKSKIDNLIKDLIAKKRQTTIARMPQNTDWIDVSPYSAADESDDQQYHYDRIISVMNASKQLVDQLADVKICRNEWITFVARNAFLGGMQEKGAIFDVLAMAVSDYIELILIPDNFTTPRGGSKNDDEAGKNMEAGQVNVREAYKNRPEIPEFLEKNWPQFVGDIFLCNFFAKNGAEGKEEEIIVTDNFIAFVPKKRSGWGASQAQIIERSVVSQISVGTDFHTQYQGLFSTSTTFWTLTFVTSNYTQFTRWLYLGTNENEMNQNRPIQGKTLEKLGKYFDLVQGDSFQTSDGYTTSVGFGYWWH